MGLLLKGFDFDSYHLVNAVTVLLHKFTVNLAGLKYSCCGDKSAYLYSIIEGSGKTTGNVRITKSSRGILVLPHF